MTRERWQQIRRAFDEVVLLPALERTTHLDRVCAGDAELRREVESLLIAHEAAESVCLNVPAVNLKLSVDTFAAPSRVGRRIGAYDILQEIGHARIREAYRA